MDMMAGNFPEYRERIRRRRKIYIRRYCANPPGGIGGNGCRFSCRSRKKCEIMCKYLWFVCFFMPSMREIIWNTLKLPMQSLKGWKKKKKKKIDKIEKILTSNITSTKHSQIVSPFHIRQVEEEEIASWHDGEKKKKKGKKYWMKLKGYILWRR